MQQRVYTHGFNLWREAGENIMYGTIFRLKVNPGQEQKAVEVFKEWERARKPNVKGAIGACR